MELKVWVTGRLWAMPLYITQAPLPSVQAMEEYILEVERWVGMVAHHRLFLVVLRSQVLGADPVKTPILAITMVVVILAVIH
jgi:hypothetical protein